MQKILKHLQQKFRKLKSQSRMVNFDPPKIFEPRKKKII